MNLASSTDTAFIQMLIELVIKNLEDEDFGAEELIRESGLRRKVLMVRMKSITRKTISQFICEVRLRKAYLMLTEGTLTVSEVAYQVGFGSPEYFIRRFHRFYGYTPGELKKRNGRVEEPLPSGLFSSQQGSLPEKIKTISKHKKIFYSSVSICLLIIIGYLFFSAFLNRSGSVKLPSESTQEKTLIADATNLHQMGDLYPEQRPHNDSISETMVNRALKIDSTDPEAYNLLSAIYRIRGFPDTALLLIEKSIGYDPGSSRAYTNKAMLFGDDRIAEKEELLNMAIRLNRNNSVPYNMLGQIYYNRGEFARGVEFTLKAIKIVGPPERDFRATFLQKHENYTFIFSNCLFRLGFFKEAKLYADNYLKITNNAKPPYFYLLFNALIINSRIEEAYTFGLQNAVDDESPYYNFMMGYALLYLHKYGEALRYFDKGSQVPGKEPDNNSWKYMEGYALFRNGKTKQAEEIFKTVIEDCTGRIKKTRFSGSMDGYHVNPYITLTSVYSLLGEETKALTYLKEDRNSHPVLDLRGLVFLKKFPMLDNIRDEPFFKDYLNDIESKFQSERKKTGNLLRREGILMEEISGR
jgi:AraC-like DNA-binding protein/tetratricopeptide (TPR) repeat protein